MTSTKPSKPPFAGRFPTLVGWLAAAGFLGLSQALVLVWDNQDVGGLEMAVGMGRFGLVSGGLTMVVLFPLIVLLRRLHPQGRGEQRGRVTQSICFSLAVAISAWMVADLWAAGPLVSEALEWPFELGAALVAAFVAYWVRPPRVWLMVGAVITVVLLALSLLPIAPSTGPDTGAEDQESRPPGPLAEGLKVISGPKSGPPPDVVLVTIDTLRADFLGAYGYSPSLTPEMDQIADEGVVFGRVLAPSPWTVPSVASLMTGLPSVRHGAGRSLSASGPAFVRSSLKDGYKTLAEIFAAAGYRTRGVVSNGFLSASMGMSQGFEVYENLVESAMVGTFIGEVPLGRLVRSLINLERLGDFRAEGVTQRGLHWLAEEDRLAEEDAAPLFLWVHYIDPHVPLQADPSELNVEAFMEMIKEKDPDVLDDGTVVGDVFTAVGQVRGGGLRLGVEDRKRLRDYYGRAVKYTDQHVGRLFAALRKRGPDRPTIAVLTSDHGEEFWDHGHFEHGHDYYSEVTRVPLIVWSNTAEPTSGVPAGRRVESLAGLLDVGPTLLELAGFSLAETSAVDEGRSVVDLWRTEEESVAPRVRFSGGNLYDLPAVLMEEGPWRFILRANGQQELYNVIEDPDERFNVVYNHPELALRFRQVLEPRLAVFLEQGTGADEEMSPETLKALKALGYVQ